jgi:NAD(P)-dependent dehydrogenase (short-subunit alcohol dehydrogenase family)
MREQGEGHIVNTASLAGLTTTAGMGPYNVAKHGVVTLSETLFHELAMEGSPVGVSVLCPAFVRTRIHESGRNAPDGVIGFPAGGDDGGGGGEDVASAMAGVIKGLVEGGIDPAEVARQVHDAIVDRRYYIVTHPETMPWITGRVQRIADGLPPMGSFG